MAKISKSGTSKDVSAVSSSCKKKIERKTKTYRNQYLVNQVRGDRRIKNHQEKEDGILLVSKWIWCNGAAYDVGPDLKSIDISRCAWTSVNWSVIGHDTYRLFDFFRSSSFTSFHSKFGWKKRKKKTVPHATNPANRRSSHWSYYKLFHFDFGTRTPSEDEISIHMGPQSPDGSQDIPDLVTIQLARALGKWFVRTCVCNLPRMSGFYLYHSLKLSKKKI